MPQLCHISLVGLGLSPPAVSVCTMPGTPKPLQCQRPTEEPAPLIHFHCLLVTEHCHIFQETEKTPDQGLDASGMIKVTHCRPLSKIRRGQRTLAGTQSMSFVISPTPPPHTNTLPQPRPGQESNSAFRQGHLGTRTIDPGHETHSVPHSSLPLALPPPPTRAKGRQSTSSSKCRDHCRRKGDSTGARCVLAESGRPADNFGGVYDRIT